MRYLLLIVVFLIGRVLEASPTKLTQEVSLPIVIDGKAVGSMKLPLGAEVEVISNDGTNAVIQRGGASYTIAANNLPNMSPVVAIHLPEAKAVDHTSATPAPIQTLRSVVASATPAPAPTFQRKDISSASVGKESRQTVKTYNVTWELNPAKGRKMNGKYYIPLPSRNLPYQDASYEITNCAIKEIVDSDLNTILFFIPYNSSSLKIICSVAVKDCDYKSALSFYTGGSNYPSDIQPYLGATDRINPNSSAVINIARNLKASDNIQTINNTLVWIKKNITYKREGFTSVDEILHRRYAECGGHSALFSALCRANKIPAREVWGVVEADTSFTPAGHLKGHLWSEVYLVGLGWVPVEPQILGSLGKLPRTYIRMYSYEPFMHITGNYNEAYNIFIMDGDKPEFSN
jgi:hypothetical protein